MSDRRKMHLGDRAHPVRDAEILRRVKAGASPSSAALAMGLTKDLVAGVMARAGITSDRHKRLVDRHAVKALPPLPDPPPTKQCQWIDGPVTRGEPINWCPCDRAPGKPYCRPHQERVYAPKPTTIRNR